MHCRAHAVCLRHFLRALYQHFWNCRFGQVIYDIFGNADVCKYRAYLLPVMNHGAILLAIYNQHLGSCDVVNGIAEQYYQTLTECRHIG